ncbi:RagB/SusD family nutrient uptake outer membrane protein [Fibrivirga algicola]|uniref:RagB/SusD family nutrient uptake outer membrane protein n=1 Tax=Fibrivirga algicola TaxID=2950420 RepID=A0ABX0QI48_9BACT|nr:RagB/SusD family nutrient uptake outer membrane protein [Fibrivirga algicola]NID12100.1 RagB/SusD family nutrient uptake outer membrane protein [Fibrivirga algicola]
MKSNIVKVVLLSSLALTFSCNDSILDKVNPTQLSTETYFKTGNELVTGVNAVYAGWQGLNLYGREYFFLHDLRGDDMQPGGSQLEIQRAQLINGGQDASNTVANDVWLGLYRVIHRANVVISFAPGVQQSITEELRNRVVGEAKFHRAWAYYELVSIWGGVPLYKTYATSPDESQPRATQEQVYELVISDLKEAIAGLPLKSAYSDNDIGRVSKGAAQSMLARVYMQRGDYAAAREQLAAVIASNQYKLTDNYIDNFREENEFNSESVWEISFTEAFGGLNWSGDGNGVNGEVTIRGQEYGPNAWRNLIPSNGLLAEFETRTNGSTKDDTRFRDSFYQVGDTFNNGTQTLTDIQGAEPKISWKKYQKIYKAASENSQSGINFRVIRYAEVLLMMAECENEVGSPATAVTYLNQVRARPSVAMPGYPTAKFPTTTKAQVFTAVVHEKRVELGGEQIRNLDILRWRKQNKLAQEPISYFAPNKHELLPIPQTEINNNSKISQTDQNPGY